MKCVGVGGWIIVGFDSGVGLGRSPDWELVGAVLCCAVLCCCDGDCGGVCTRSRVGGYAEEVSVDWVQADHGAASDRPHQDRTRMRGSTRTGLTWVANVRRVSKNVIFPR